ncbi:MAG: methyltransferase domain-containing protein [Actinomycetota bacterium]
MSATWTTENLRHAVRMLRYGGRPAETVYDSIGEDFFLALAPGWLNLGLWEGDGSDPTEAAQAPRRLVEKMAKDLPKNGVILDVGNGLGVQDPVIAQVAQPRALTALNITFSQLHAGRASLAEAGARAVNGDASRIPLRDAFLDGVISVEAAFHFPSRDRFFREARRVLKPGGVLTMSDIPTNRYPLGLREGLAALSQLRVWGLGRQAAVTPGQIAASAERAGFGEVEVELAGERVIGPALRFVRLRLDRAHAAHEMARSYELAARIMVAQVELLWERRIIDYLFLRATR